MLGGLFEDVKSDLNGVKSDLSQVAAAADIKQPATPGTSVEKRPAQAFDLDAT